MMADLRFRLDSAAPVCGRTRRLVINAVKHLFLSQYSFPSLIDLEGDFRLATDELVLFLKYDPQSHTIVITLDELRVSESISRLRATVEFAPSLRAMIGNELCQTFYNEWTQSARKRFYDSLRLFKEEPGLFRVKFLGYNWYEVRDDIRFQLECLVRVLDRNTIIVEQATFIHHNHIATS